MNDIDIIVAVSLDFKAKFRTVELFEREITLKVRLLTIPLVQS